MKRSTPVKRKRGGGVAAVLARPPKRQRPITESLTSPPKARCFVCSSSVYLPEISAYNHVVQQACTAAFPW